MPEPKGFRYTQRADGSVIITHEGQVAAVLRGKRAGQFLDDIDDDPQLAMARWTGNYKRGNERIARNHPRNQR